MGVDLETIYKELKEVKRMLRENKRIDAIPELLSEAEVCLLLNISRKTLSNYVSNGTIGIDMISTGVGGNKFFEKNKIMGVCK
ncbi:hypothetical protein [Ferruginibacter sp.]